MTKITVCWCACIVICGSFALQAQTVVNIDNEHKIIDKPDTILQTEQISVDTNIEINHKTWLLKTNLLYMCAGVFNLAAEYSFSNRLSVDIPVTYSPYSISRTYKIRTLSIQPELRWWMKEPLTGHFLGFHTHLAFYNIALDTYNRYQDKDGKTPLWGAGFSYGYVLRGKGKWNFEFTLGIGYAHLNYDIFYNVDNGSVYNSKIKNYWGLTKAGVTVSYRLTKNDEK
ncbi:MAG: DUF3575 domain-containing protein [Prevotellaceae bacterium]|nr:DUF3575 domain-containing protein [Prevotellaceae bacterium]